MTDIELPLEIRCPDCDVITSQSPWKPHGTRDADGSFLLIGTCLCPSCHQRVVVLVRLMQQAKIINTQFRRVPPAEPGGLAEFLPQIEMDESDDDEGTIPWWAT